MKTTLRTWALGASIALALGSMSLVSALETPTTSTTTQLADARRESQIQTSFIMNRHLRSFDLSVVVNGDKATLGGTVEHDIAKELAQQIAMGVDGIARVDNRIQVDPLIRVPDHASSDRNFNEKVGDATITATIKSKLLWNSRTDGLDIHVDTTRGAVRLTGSAGSEAERVLAERIANATEGVISLANEIVIQQKPASSAAPTAVASAMSDAWITSKVTSSLVFTRGINAQRIVIRTSDGVVWLSGGVDSVAERELAIRVAEDVRGVKKVDGSALKVG
ncbi:MAG: BON domain-containing protein [Tahibacter sp.]